LSNEQIAELLGISPETWRRWLTDRKPNPAAVRLLAILAGYMPWDGWQGWAVENGYLFPPGFRKNGLRPEEYQAVIYYRALARDYRAKMQNLEAELDQLRLQLQALEREQQHEPRIRLVAS
jgi:transcriptional regulator with XRE-family HTH domain